MYALIIMCYVQQTKVAIGGVKSQVDKICSVAELKLMIAEKRAAIAEERAVVAEARTTSAEGRASIAEETASVADKKATNAEERAITAEKRAVGAEERKAAAESRASLYEERAISAETRAALAEQRATVAEQRAMGAEGKASAAEKRAIIAEKACVILKQKLSDTLKQATVAEDSIKTTERRATIGEESASAAKMEASVQESRASVAEARAAVAEKRAFVAEERAKVAEMEATAAKEKVTNANSKLITLEERANKAEGTVTRLQEHARVSNIRITELVQTNIALQASVTRAEQQIQDVTLQCKALQEQLDKAITPTWVVKKEDIIISDKELGRGGWGVVKAARFCGLEVAAKLLHGAILSPYNQQLFKREMNISALVRHPNVLLFIGATMDQECVILTELMHTSLRAVLEDKAMKKVTLTHQQVCTIATDVGRALNYLHLMKPDTIIHRDVSSSNVLLEPLGADMWKAKLSDFGSSNFARQVTTVAPGNFSYAAPESANPLLQSPKMDVFSYGILLLEMSYGQFPDVQKRQDLIIKLSWPKMKTMIEQCVAMEPCHRPSMTDVLIRLSDIRS